MLIVPLNIIRFTYDWNGDYFSSDCEGNEWSLTEWDSAKEKSKRMKVLRVPSNVRSIQINSQSITLLHLQGRKRKIRCKFLKIFFPLPREAQFNSNLIFYHFPSSIPPSQHVVTRAFLSYKFTHRFLPFAVISCSTRIYT